MKHASIHILQTVNVFLKENNQAKLEVIKISKVTAACLISQVYEALFSLLYEYLVLCGLVGAIVKRNQNCRRCILFVRCVIIDHLILS